ncbi:fungal hydrophobin [Gloeophyllum trabeum ATCC 11539]|uniref:Hydrophobin n=1 Tax=Gloeophyllum trabeum (strain ATCC 11539 / FP-39264 / Madison 617) TaxID=670483 RepID=S7R933_GLOTA|nr:fungal hydrophobin [Gloeophyllum trabeum ATCC 11539]EPQ50810.1 fungal hydrophobin [Gloeophyllum trabeum ATCC 11539]
MKFTSVAAVLAACVLSASAVATPTNAERMKRGLPPAAPKRRFSASHVQQAKRTAPSATPPPNGGGDMSGSCNTGPVQCCNQVQQGKSVTSILGLLGVVLDDLEALVGIDCSPIDVLGLGGNSCSAHPVCCENNSNSLISVGCIPITL